MNSSVCETCHQNYNPQIAKLYEMLDRLDEGEDPYNIVETIMDTVLCRMQLKHAKRPYAKRMLQLFYDLLCESAHRV